MERLLILAFRLAGYAYEGFGSLLDAMLRRQHVAEPAKVGVALSPFCTPGREDPATRSIRPAWIMLLWAALLSAMPLPAAAVDITDILDGKGLRELGRQSARESARERRERATRERMERQESARSDRMADCQRVAAWYTGTEHIPPEALASRFGGGSRGDGGSPAMTLPYEAWLLQDARFEPAFGIRYDDMAVEDGKRLHQASRGGCRMPTNERGQAMSDGMLLFRAFDARYQPRYVQAVRQIREAHATIRQTQLLLADLPPGEMGRKQLAQHAAQRRALEGYLDEGGRNGWRQAFVDAYARVVDPANEARVAAAVAKSSGLDGLQSLSRLQAELVDEARAAGVDFRLPPALRQHQDALAAQVANAERARVDALGSGVVALERGAQWYADYRQRLAPHIADTAPGRELMRHFEVRRGSALNAAERDLSRRIAATRSDNELQALVARYLPLEQDQRHPAGTALFTRVAMQRDELHKRSVLGSSPSSAKSEQPAGHVSRPASGSGEPSESEMYDAFNAVLQAQNAAAQETAERCNKRQYQNDPLLGVQCIEFGLGVGTTGGGQNVRAPQFRIANFQKLGCEKAQSETGWRCDYAAGISGNLQMPPSMARLMGAGNMGQARFVRRGDGWLMIADPPRNF